MVSCLVSVYFSFFIKHVRIGDAVWSNTNCRSISLNSGIEFHWCCSLYCTVLPRYAYAHLGGSVMKPPGVMSRLMRKYWSL